MSLHYVPGDQMEVVGIPITLRKVDEVDKFGNQLIGPDGKSRQRCGFRIGGGIDQDNAQSPQGYTDKGVYITHIEEGGPASVAGLLVNDKLLQVNGIDFTMVTHEKACKYIRKDPVLQIIVQRNRSQQTSYNTPVKGGQQMYQGYTAPNNSFGDVLPNYQERY